MPSQPDSDIMHLENNEKNHNTMQFPHYASGTVVKGFGRGSKQLGVPTANFPDSVVNVLPDEFQQGVYYGWAQVDSGTVYKMVMSVGNNPYYNNEKRTMETYIMHEFGHDFYGSNLKVVITGYIRPMTSYKSLGKHFNSIFELLMNKLFSIKFIYKDDLIAAIHKDISDAKAALDLPENEKYKNDEFFNQNYTNTTNPNLSRL